MQRLHRQLQILLRRILLFGVTQTSQALGEEHDRRHVPGHLRRVVQRPAREPVRLPNDFVHRLLGHVQKLRMKWKRLYLPELLPLYFGAFFFGDPFTLALCGFEHVGEDVGVEGALV